MQTTNLVSHDVPAEAVAGVLPPPLPLRVGMQAAGGAATHCRHAAARACFNSRQLTDADHVQLLAMVASAFEAGEREVMLVAFPSEFCIDGGRWIESRRPGWRETLPDGARGFLDWWHSALQSSGVGLHARVLHHCGEAPGEVGLFVTRGGASRRH